MELHTNGAERTEHPTRLGTLLFRLQLIQNLPVEWGIDQLVEVDQAAEVNRQLPQLSADGKEPSW